MKIVAIIPARYGSQRLPGKPLALIAGRPMIEHVVRRAEKATRVAEVIVATDDERIAAAVRGFGGEVEMTRADHPTGTDRLAEVAARIDTTLIVNVQGDEPLIDPRMIDQAVAPVWRNPGVSMGTLKTRITSVEEYLSPNVVKVVTDRNGFALYFSRASIPHPRDLAGRLEETFPRLEVFKHIGLYVYRRDFLLAYPKLSATPLEEMEKLEQLRALEHGFKIKVAETRLTSVGVDTPEDLERVRQMLLQTGNGRSK
ncbi:3-deoxy-manno-octulosonate cytidylyltransferase [bacterium]|nr:3-deoxy-manno-octulosonate cytidylyltransferase [bacterium]